MSGRSEDNDEEIILKRRIDRRLEARAKSDMPWARKAVGFGIIVLAFVFGWRMLNRQSAEIIRHIEKPSVVETPAPTSTPISSAPSKSGLVSTIAPIASDVDSEPAKLDGATLNTIAECTKGVNPLRLLDFNKKTIADGNATMESIFKPVLIAERGSAKRSVQLQNVRIRLKSGEELRLHAAPKTQNGQLYLKLFRVAGDGLPEEFEFPDSIKDLKDQPLSDHAVTKFLQLAEIPGRALEVERHESWSYPEKTGAQIIWSGDQIHELQVFMRSKFLSCSRGSRAGSPTVNCKCIDRKAE